MPTTVYLPIDFLNPMVKSGFGGNSYWSVQSGIAWDRGVWQFISGNEGRIYGIVHVPSIIAASPAPQISLVCDSPQTSGLTFFKVNTKAIASGASFDPSSLTGESGYSVSIPTTALNRFDVLFPSGGTLAETISGNSVLIVEVAHSGPTVTNIIEGLLRVDLS